MKVKVHHLITCLKEIQSIRCLTKEQLEFKENVDAVVDYLRHADEFHTEDTVVEFY